MNKFKFIILSALTVCTLPAVKSFASQNNPFPAISISNPGGPKIKWKKDVHDFGEIVQGKPVSVEFSFTNNGNEPFVINDVVPSCGCTAPVFPKEAIAPGQSAIIKVTYNAVNKGSFSKTVTVKSNGEEAVKVLTIKGTVM